MSNKITKHNTGAAEILFLAAARPMSNNKSGKTEYTVKLKFNESDAKAMELKEHLMAVADYKIDTKTNRQLNGEFIVNFSSDYAPKVYTADGTELTGRDIPFFDSRIDTGIASVGYKVIDYGNNKIVRLNHIKLLELNLAPRENAESTESVDSLRAKLSQVK